MSEDVPTGSEDSDRFDPLPARGAGVEGGNERKAPFAGPVGDDAELRESLAGLSQLASGQMDLREALTRVAEFAVAAIPGADGAGLTLLEAGRADTIVASAPFVSEVDAIQYGIGEGPCISAAGEARTVRAGELATDSQWPAFGPRIAHLGVHSALSLPLLSGDGVLGAMNVYARTRDAFDDYAARVGEFFAVPAAIAVQNAQVLARARRLAEDLQVALERRAVIDQATGIVMNRDGCSADDALARLRLISQRENETLPVTASRFIDDAVQRSRTRPEDS